MKNENTIEVIERLLEKLIKLAGTLDVKLLNIPEITGKKYSAGSAKNSGDSNIEASKLLMLEAMKGSVSCAQGILKLFGESESAVGRILNYFMQFLGLVNQGISIGNVISELISFIPGGGLITGGAAGGGAAGLGGINNLIRPDYNIQPDITVFVQSEVEKTKAVKFLRNYNPQASARINSSNISN